MHTKAQCVVTWLGGVYTGSRGTSRPQHGAPFERSASGDGASTTAYCKPLGVAGANHGKRVLDRGALRRGQLRDGPRNKGRALSDAVRPSDLGRGGRALAVAVRVLHPAHALRTEIVGSSGKVEKCEDDTNEHIYVNDKCGEDIYM